MRIYGHSDDCIEIEGDQFREEFSLTKPSFLRFPDGLVIEATFCKTDDEAWRFRVVENPAGVSVVESGPNEDDDYELTIGHEYSEVWHDKNKDGPTVDQVRDFFEAFDRNDHDDAALLEAYKILRHRGG